MTSVNKAKETEVKPLVHNDNRGKNPRRSESSSRNAIKHGILSQRITEDEEQQFKKLIDRLSADLQPEGTLQYIVIERMAVHIMQLDRISHARNEFMKQAMNPGAVINELDGMLNSFVRVVDPPYKPEIDSETVEKLMSLYHRYEVSAENRLYRAMKEFGWRGSH